MESAQFVRLFRTSLEPDRMMYFARAFAAVFQYYLDCEVVPADLYCVIPQSPTRQLISKKSAVCVTCRHQMLHQYRTVLCGWATPIVSYLPSRERRQTKRIPWNHGTWDYKWCEVDEMDWRYLKIACQPTLIHLGHCHPRDFRLTLVSLALFLSHLLVRLAPTTFEGEKRLEQSYASPGTASPVSSKVRVERWNLENLVQLSW